MRIPASVRITPKISYEVSWVDSFSDPDTLGECRDYSKQIVLKKKQSARSLDETFLHECLHAIDFIDTGTRNYWGFNAGSLIDKRAFAFQYGKDHRFKACVGVGIILDDGKYPIFIPI